MTERRLEPETPALTVPSPLADADSVVVPISLPRERRRSSRAEPPSHLQAELSMVSDIEVIDLSEAGLLLACDCAFDIGHRTQVRLLLGADPFVGWIEVKRVTEIQVPTPGKSKRFLVGAALVSIDDRSARVLRAFLPGRHVAPAVV